MMRRRILFFVCLMLITVLSMTSCNLLTNIFGGYKELNAQEIYEFIAPSVVVINAQSQWEQSSGTGFFFNDGSTIVTNYHVIENCTTASITLSTGEEYEVESILGYSEEKDIAILKVSCTNGIPLKTRETEVKTGEKVYAIGNSLGFLDGSLSEGIISTAKRDIDGATYIQTTAAVTHGNSGGPLIDSYGKVIGIVSAGFGDGLDLNLAIPISQIDTIDASGSKTLEEIFHKHQPPQFTWIENEEGFNVTAQFCCSCGETNTVSTFVSNTDYTVFQNESKTRTTFEFTAEVILNGITYRDTRYIKYEYQVILLNNSNYEDYLSVSCVAVGWRGIRASVRTKDDGVDYSNVSVTFNITATGREVYGGYDGVYPYYSRHTVNVGINEEKEVELASQVYSLQVKYTVQVSGSIFRHVMTAYLSQN